MRSKGLFREMSLALVLAAGAGAVWVVLVLWSEPVAEHVMGRRAPSAELMVLAGGTPVVAEVDGGGGTTYRDLDGNPVRRTREVFAQIGARPLPAGPELDAEPSWDRRVRAFADGGAPAVFWY